MRVLVTGATSVLGHAVVAALVDHGHVVSTLSRQTQNVPAESARHVTADVASSPAVAEAVAEVDAVCHLAGLARVRESLTEPLAYWRTNVGGALNMLDGLGQSSTPNMPKRLVLASTGAVYGAPERQPITEDAPAAPTNPYAATKLAADQAAEHLAATGVIGATSLRAFNISGGVAGRTDHDTTRLIPKILAVRAGQANALVINGDGSAVRDFVHVADMADAFARALDACEPGSWRAYNIGSGRRTSVRDVVAAAESVTGRAVPVHHRPPANEPAVLLADASRARSELHWQPARSNIDEIIKDAWNAWSGSA